MDPHTRAEVEKMREAAAKIADSHSGYRAVKPGTNFDILNRGRNNAASRIAKEIRALTIKSTP